MKTIKEHIKTNNYKQVYLLYGTEAYLKRFYAKKLKDGVLADGDEMNASAFAGKNIDWVEVQNLSDTLPFFADRRVILLENTGAFKAACDFADYIAHIPDSTVLIFIEEEVDKRNRLYKAVKEHGHVCELNGMSEKDLKLWTAQLLQKEGKKIKETDLEFFLERVGSDMNHIMTEVEKLVCYTYGRDVVERQDILAVTSEQITGKIFQMIDALAVQNQAQALALYYDLLTLREKPMTILYLIVRQFNLMLQAKALSAPESGLDKGAIASKVGVAPFVAGKCLSQCRHFSKKQLMDAIMYGTELEQQVKTGKLVDQLAVELLLVWLNDDKNA